MPSITDRRSVRASALNQEGAGSEPSGELTAPPPGILDEVSDEMRRKLPDELVDELLAGARTEEEVVGPGGLLSQLTKRLVERAMEVELTDHLGYEPHQEPPGGAGNTRNGSTPKRLITEHGEVPIDTPRDRAGTFEPRIVRKRQRRFEGFDDKILGLYSRGLSTRDIEAHLQEIYGVRVGRDLISRVTDAMMDDARAWQTRPLDDVYPVLFLDALVLKIRDGGTRAAPCLLPRDGDRDGRRARRARDVVPGQRGRQILDAGPGAPRGAAESNGGERPSSPGRRSGWVEAEGSLIRETPGRVASGPDNDGTGRHCQTAWARQARQKGVREEPAF